MKVITIAFKDLLQQFRSLFAVGMMFVVPLTITGLIYLAFGNMGSSTDRAETYSLPVIQVQMVNLDQGDKASGFKAGAMLVDLLKHGDLADVFAVSETQDEQLARSAVDDQKAAVAVLIPENFSQAVFSGEIVEVTLYQDPALSFGPGLVKEVVAQFIDGFTGSRIASSVTMETFNRYGLTVDPSMMGQAQAEYGQYLQSLNAEEGWNIPVDWRQPAAAETAETAQTNSIMGMVMAGMLIFFMFFTGANTAGTITKEQEQGTLARMFTTPTPILVILGGKFASIFMLLLVQAVVLLLLSSLFFGIHWGSLILLVPVVIGWVVAAAGFGLFVVSFVKTSQQAGAMLGGMLSVTGMMGGLMTTGFTNMPAIFDTINLIVPQGWALRAIRQVLDGAAAGEVLLTTAVMLAIGALCFTLGARKFSSRFV